MTTEHPALRRELLHGPFVLGAFGAYLLMHAVAEVAAGAGRDGSEPLDVSTVAGVEAAMRAQLFGVLAVVGWAIVIPPRPTWPDARPWLLRGIGFYLAFFAVWFPLTYWVWPLVLEALGSSLSAQPHLRYFFADLDEPRPGWWVSVAVVCVAGPVAEEVIFRGLLQPGLQGVLGRWSGLLAASALFGLVHGTHIAVPLALLGFCYGWIREKSGGLAAPIAAHALHNAITVGSAVAFPEFLAEMYSR